MCRSAWGIDRTLCLVDKVGAGGRDAGQEKVEFLRHRATWYDLFGGRVLAALG